jgi:hypothetical protein
LLSLLMTGGPAKHFCRSRVSGAEVLGTMTQPRINTYP